MTSPSFTCPRCRFAAERESGVRFCPRCGLPDDRPDDQAPLDIDTTAGRITVCERFAYGDVCNLYRCTLARSAQEGVFKIARTPAASRHVAREADVLNRLHAADRDLRVAPFLPKTIAAVNYAHADGGPARAASILTYHADIGHPGELYTLEEVRDAYPDGIDARDMAWMWRRLLTVLGFVHESGLVHTVVSPDHVLIEPREHKVVLIGWCNAVSCGQAPILKPARWAEWRNSEIHASPTMDLGNAARTMRYLLDATIEPAVARHLDRAGESSATAWRLLSDFDQMIEALWGPRRFRTFAMPARRAH